jgi:hypothetical protein
MTTQIDQPAPLSKIVRIRVKRSPEPPAPAPEPTAPLPSQCDSSAEKSMFPVCKIKRIRIKFSPPTSEPATAPPSQFDAPTPEPTTPACNIKRTRIKFSPPPTETAPATPPPSPKRKRADSPDRPSKKQRVEAPKSPTPLPVEPLDEDITDEERSLRIAEAEVLFPKYMSAVDYRQSDRAKRATSGQKSPLLYLPSSEYNGWRPDLDCSPSALGQSDRRSKVTKWFEKDFARKFAPPLFKSIPLPLDKKYLKEWQERHLPTPAPSPMHLEAGPLRYLVENFTPTKGQSHFREQADLGREVDSAWYSPRELLAAKALLQFS